MFVDTLPSPYYDILIVNTFVEFGDLMYSVRRIEDGIKRGRIRDTRATTFGKKGNVPNKHVEERSRRKFEAMGESVGNLFHSRTPCTQVPPIRCFSPQVSAWKSSQGSDSGYYQSKKNKMNKVYHSLLMSYTKLLPYWFRIMGFLSFLQGLGDLHIQKSTMSMLCVNTMEELEGTPWKIARLSKTWFNSWFTQIRLNSENLSVVIRSIKINDQLGAVLFVFWLWMFSFVNVLFEKCKHCFNVSMCMKWMNLCFGYLCH